MKTMEETYKRYLLWKAEVDKAAQAPENQKVIEQIREKYELDELTDNIRLYQNANLLKGGPDAKKFGWDGLAATKPTANMNDIVYVSVCVQTRKLLCVI